MRRTRYNGDTIADKLSDLKYGELRCIKCHKVMPREEAIPELKGSKMDPNVSINSVVYCSSSCRNESHKAYDRRVTGLI